MWRLCCFAGSVLVTLAALISPIDALADQLFFAHMIQHMLLLDLAPILAILGFTKVILRPVTRAVHDIERRAGPLAHPAFAVVLYVGVIWAWHVPAAYDLAVRHAPVHVLEHLSFIVAGSLYWWHLLSPIRARMRLDGWGRSPTWPPRSCSSARSAWGSRSPPRRSTPTTSTRPACGASLPRDDQAIAGLIMAVEQSIVMGIAIVVLFVRALTESERAQQRRERYERYDCAAPTRAPRRATAGAHRRARRRAARAAAAPRARGRRRGRRAAALSSSRRALRIWSAIATPAGVSARRARPPPRRRPRSRSSLCTGGSAPRRSPAERAISSVPGDAVAAEAGQRPDRAGAQLDTRAGGDPLADLPPALARPRAIAQRAIDLGQRAVAPSAPPARPRGRCWSPRWRAAGAREGRRLSTKPTGARRGRRRRTPAASALHVGALVGDRARPAGAPTCAPVSRAAGSHLRARAGRATAPCELASAAGSRRSSRRSPRRTSRRCRAPASRRRSLRRAPRRRRRSAPPARAPASPGRGRGRARAGRAPSIAGGSCRASSRESSEQADRHHGRAGDREAPVAAGARDHAAPRRSRSTRGRPSAGSAAARPRSGSSGRRSGRTAAGTSPSRTARSRRSATAAAATRKTLVAQQRQRQDRFAARRSTSHEAAPSSTTPAIATRIVCAEPQAHVVPPRLATSTIALSAAASRPAPR